MGYARAIVVFSALLLTPSALAQTALTTLESKFPVKETADRLEAALTEKGLKVAARVNHAAGATAAGLEMPPTEVLMFGNPKLGTPLMLANPEIAIELPMKIVIWQSKDGKAMVGYVDPETLKQRYGITGQDETFKTMTGALGAFAKAAAGQ
jgi:uncharacterized protein (DUF302 family)